MNENALHAFDADARDHRRAVSWNPAMTFRPRAAGACWQAIAREGGPPAGGSIGGGAPALPTACPQARATGAFLCISSVDTVALLGALLRPE